MIHSGGTSSVQVDQRNGAGQGGALWYYLGSFDLDPAAAPGHGVALLASLSGSVSADAIRFVKQGGASGISTILSDQIGQPQKMLDGATAALTWDRAANPFGDTAQMALGSSTANPLRFPGQQYDPVSGLHYNYFRDYDPSLGRYVQSDPIGLEGGVNTYGYVGGNPVSYFDPRGLAVYPADFYGPILPGDCYSPIPMHLPGAAVDANMKEAADMWPDPWAFRDAVKNKGKWDYKQQGSQYEHFGNFNYGPAGHAFGYRFRICC